MLEQDSGSENNHGEESSVERRNLDAEWKTALAVDRPIAAHPSLLLGEINNTGILCMPNGSLQSTDIITSDRRVYAGNSHAIY